MIRKTRLYTPGPTPLLPAAQFAMAAADMHHRTAEFRALFQKVLAQLKVFVGTKNDVLLLACSGTGAMEASVSNLTSPGDKVLVLTAGKFGERWVDLAKAFGCVADVVEKPYGQTFDLAQVKAALKPEHKAVYMQATETSTAVRHDVEAVATLMKETGSQALLVVDGITGLGTTHFDVDAWGIDVIIGGSQKALMIPPREMKVPKGNFFSFQFLLLARTDGSASSSNANAAPTTTPSPRESNHSLMAQNHPPSIAISFTSPKPMPS